MAAEALQGLGFAKEKEDYIVDTLDPTLGELVTAALLEAPETPEGTVEFLLGWCQKRSGLPPQGAMGLRAKNSQLKKELQRLEADLVCTKLAAEVNMPIAIILPLSMGGHAHSMNGDGVVVLDINGTIVEGDTMKGVPTTDFTTPVIELFKQLGPRAKVVYYTFGQDWEQVLAWAYHHRKTEVKHKFFIARHAQRVGETWAFNMAPRSRYIDWATKNPVILDDAENGKDTFPTSFEQQPEAQAFRFKTSADFQRFVDALLRDGDVVFRAAYAPGNPSFLGRTTDGPKAKVFACGSSFLVFDDHPEDWELLTKTNGEVIRAKTPMGAGVGPSTDFVAELRKRLPSISM